MVPMASFMIRYVLGLLVVLMLAALTLLAAGRLHRHRERRGTPGKDGSCPGIIPLHRVSSLSLDRRVRLHLVRAGPHMLLVSVGDDGCRLVNRWKIDQTKGGGDEPPPAESLSPSCHANPDGRPPSLVQPEGRRKPR